MPAGKAGSTAAVSAPELPARCAAWPSWAFSRLVKWWEQGALLAHNAGTTFIAVPERYFLWNAAVHFGRQCCAYTS